MHVLSELGWIIGSIFSVKTYNSPEDFLSINISANLFFVFGKESVGLPNKLLGNNGDKLFKIPIYSPHVRSLNLANAVSVVVFEGLRSLAISKSL